MRKALKQVIKEELDKMKGRINSMQEAIEHVEDQAREMVKKQNRDIKEYGVKLMRISNRTKQSNMDPENVVQLAKTLEVILTNVDLEGKFSLYPAYSYMADTLEKGD